MLLLALVLWLAGLGLLALNRAKGSYRPTGDELFDRYARLVLSQQHKFRNEPWLHKTLAGLGVKLPFSAAQPEAIDFSAIRGWEAEFGDDPRYWELRAACSMDIGADTVPKIQEKIRSGVASGGMLMQACIWQVNDADPAQALELVDKVIAAEPENSYAYYIKGDLLFEQGDLPGALVAYTAGNSAQHNRMPLAFPISIIAEQPERFTTPDERLVAGYTWCAYELVASPDAQRMKAQAMLMAGLAHKPSHTALADAYWQRVSRMGQMEDQSASTQKLMGSLLKKMGTEYVLSGGNSGKIPVDDGGLFNQLGSHAPLITDRIRQHSKTTSSGFDTYQGFGLYTRKNVMGGLADYLAWQVVLEQNRSDFKSIETPPFSAWNAERAAAAEAAQAGILSP